MRGNHDSPSADITPANAEYLRNLPFNWQDVIEGRRLFICHGIPGVPFIGLHRDHVTDNQLNSLLIDVQADIVIVGHTHVPMVKQVESGYVINPGSVYLRSQEGTSHSYAVLQVPDFSCDIFDLTREPGTLLDWDST